MTDPAPEARSAGGTPRWGDARQTVMVAAEICATAAVTLAMRGPHGAHAVLMLRQAVDALRDVSAQLREPAFHEAVAAAERSRASAADALGAAAPRGHLRAVR